MDRTLVSILVAGSSALIVSLGLLVVLRLRRRRLPYTRRRSLLTAAELRFYRSLLIAVPDGLTIFVKVRLMDIVDVPDEAWREFGAPGSGIHLDFVLADAASTEPRMVIELDDRSHSRAEVRQRDAFKNAALSAAGVAILRISVSPNYDAQELRASVRAALG
jgi:hypothetical protein